ncbi:MFS transporter [Cereibacter sphaeroides]|uniref:TCR/Tet family MFS transporter n=1 Tax=Cereibacter sphaeroides TaxID=1063 RepID=UPI000F54109E|nr:TCR/Tet family MFS transporter [Cereibacter sphaeroides]AZB64384.1 MFS transporter [Cereibacter sphaeroides]AZB67684.1 MFS transporter [Cereibacter sphaeroides]
MQQPRLALAFILITVALDAIGIGLIFPVMPDLILEITGQPLSEAAVWGGLLSASFAVMQFLFGPTIGSLSDRFGRRPILLGSLVLMSGTYLAMALAPTMAILLAARIVAGIVSATYATASAFIADVTPPEDRGKRFALVGAGFGIGFVLGPALGGLLAGLDTRAPFYAAALMALLNLALGSLILPETVTDATRRAFSLPRANPLGALRAVARLPGLSRPLAVFLILGIAMNVYPAVWAFYGQAQFGWGAGMVGASLALYGISFAVGQVALVGPAIRHLGEHRTALVGIWVDIVTLAALGVLASGTGALFVIPVTALGGVVVPALQSILSRATPADAQGELQGVLASLNAIAMIASPLVMTATFRAFTAPGAPLHLPGAPFLLASLLMVGALALHVRGAGQPERDAA